jgi:hypothetical protein
MSSTPAAPGVSVVMSVYNGERFLREAVDSVLTQTLAELELIVVDDGSTDSTPQILEEYVRTDPRIIVERRTNQGRAAALNRGFAIARAPLVARLDADDIAPPDRLERQRRFLLEHPAVAVVGGAITFVDEHGRPFAEVENPLTDGEIRRAFEHATPVPHPGVMLRSQAFERAGGYRTAFSTAEDLDLWLRVAAVDRFANLPVSVVRYRMHADQDSVRKVEQQAIESIAARLAARARASGAPDPLMTASQIDHQLVIGLGATEQEVTAVVVRSVTWLAKTMGRAGYSDAAARLFAAAGARASSKSGSPELRADVLRARARRHAEQDHRVRAWLTLAKSAITARPSC